MLRSHRRLMKMDQRYSFADNLTQRTAQPISCVVSLHIAAAFTRGSGDKSLASGDHGQRRRTRKRHKRRDGGRKKQQQLRVENEKGTETKRMRRRKRERSRIGREASEKGKTFVTLSSRIIERKNNIINLLTFQYCINLSSGILWAH